MRYTIQGSRFDSILNLDSIRAGHHANLTIHMKVCLQRFEPPDGAARLQYTQTIVQNSANIVIGRWLPSDDWSGWCRQFEREAEAFVHGKLWLAPDRPWLGSAPVPGSGGRSVYRPGVRCGFRISRVPMSECHFIVDVAKTTTASGPLPPYQIQRGAVDDVRNSLRETVGWDDDPENRSTIYRACFAGSGRLLLADDDLGAVQRNNFNSVFSQRPFVHELGHAIGLGHVNGAGNTGPAYGANAHQYGDLMGAGERIEPWHAFPWKRRLERHLRSRMAVEPAVWTATTRRPPVGTATVYPVRNGPMDPGGVSLDGGVVSRCAVRGCTQRGPLGMEA